MKKSLFGFLMILALAMPAAHVNAADAAPAEIKANPAGNPVDQFTGELWMKTTKEQKQAYLFGIDSAIAVEYFVNSKEAAKAAKAGKKPVYTLSPFERGWMEAFTNVSREQAIEKVNAWYGAHPNGLDRPVLDVLWYEVIKPALAGMKK